MLDASLGEGCEQSCAYLTHYSTFRELQLVQYCWKSVWVYVCMRASKDGGD